MSVNLSNAGEDKHLYAIDEGTLQLWKVCFTVSPYGGHGTSQSPFSDRSGMWHCVNIVAIVTRKLLSDNRIWHANNISVHQSEGGGKLGGLVSAQYRTWRPWTDRIRQIDC